MGGMRRVITIAALLTLTIVPVAAALSWMTPAASPMSVAAATPPARAVSLEPLGVAAAEREPLLPPSGMLMLVGSGLLGLAFILGATTKT